jgi:hypothetical protein
MTWLVKLYPRRWRERYGAELADLVAAQPVSIAAAVDLIGGAIDAWLHPQVIPPPVPDSKGDVTMTASILQLKCVGYGPNISAADRARNATMNIAGTLALVLVWLALVWIWKHQHLAGTDYLMSLLPMTYLVPYLVGLRYTSLKGRSGVAQATVIAGISATTAAILLLAAWIATRL